MKSLAHYRHHEPPILLTAFHLPENLQLDIKQFLKLQSLARLLHGRCILGEMDIHQCLTQAHEVVAPNNIHTERVHHALLLEFGNEVCNNGANGFGVKPRTFHTLSGVIVRFQPLCHLGLYLAHRCQFGVDKIVLVIEARWLTKKQILHIALQLNILHPLEPHQFNSMSPIGKSGRQTLRITNTYSMPFCDMPDNLDVGFLILYLMDIIEATAVNILVRKLI